MKYIDTDKIRAEVERRMENYNASIEKYYGKQKSIKAERDSWKWAECKWFLNLIASLQQEQPEVDLDSEIQIWVENVRIKPTPDELRAFAIHFFNRGLNIKK